MTKALDKQDVYGPLQNKNCKQQLKLKYIWEGWQSTIYITIFFV